MTLKRFYIIVGLLLIGSHAWGQGIKDFLKFKDERPKTELEVDNNLSSGGKASGEEDLALMEEEKKEENNKKWKKYFADWNKKIQQLDNIIVLQIDSNTLPKDSIRKYRDQVAQLSEDVEDKKQTNDIWKDNEDLDNSYASLKKAYKDVLAKLQDWEEKQAQQEEANSKKKTRLLIIAGVALVVFSFLFARLQPLWMIRKTKKQQEMQLKKQMEEEQDRFLLSNEENIITLKDK